MITFSSRMRFLVVIVLLYLQLGEIWPHPDTESQDQPAVHPDEDDRELKNTEDGYDFFSIDQLFMNNPQYAKLLSDLQAHSFASTWRRKRDASAQEESENSASVPEVPEESPEESSVTAPIAEVTEVTKNMGETKNHQETPEVEGRTTPIKAISASSTTTSSTTAASSFGFSGSTEAVRVRTEEPTTSATPVRSSTPRRLLHKGNNKNKNKQTGNNKSKPQDTGSVTAQNVNKFSVANTASTASTVPASSYSASSTSQVTVSVNPNSSATSSSTASDSADASSTVANATASAGSNNKDKVSPKKTKL